MYREYLDPKYLDDFDAWREKYKNPFRDLQDGGRVRNWDDERRIGDLEADGIVGEVVFPNTVPPFFPSFVLFARPPKPDEYEHRLAGIRAHNRWLADWCARFPERRAGIGQIFLNDVDDAIEDVQWIKEHGLRGGVLISAVPPDVDYVKPLYDPVYDPLWEVCEDLEVPVNSHGGTGLPDYGQYPAAALLFITEVSFYSQRPFVQLLLLGRVRALPEAEVRDDRDGLRVAAADAASTSTGCSARSGRPAAPARCGTPRSTSCRSRRPSTSSRTAASASASPARTTPRRATRSALDRFMWGSDYPHDEGTGPFTREHLRQLFHDIDRAELQQILAGNAADALRLRPRRARAARGEGRPDGRRARASRSPSCPRTRTRRC